MDGYTVRGYGSLASKAGLVLVLPSGEQVAVTATGIWAGEEFTPGDPGEDVVVLLCRRHTMLWQRERRELEKQEA